MPCLSSLLEITALIASLVPRECKQGIRFCIPYKEDKQCIKFKEGAINCCKEKITSPPNECITLQWEREREKKTPVTLLIKAAFTLTCLIFFSVSEPGEKRDQWNNFQNWKWVSFKRRIWTNEKGSFLQVSVCLCLDYIMYFLFFK